MLVGSDGGRQGSNLDAADFLNDPQAQQDFGYLSIHTVLEAANVIVQERYGFRQVLQRRGHERGRRRHPRRLDGVLLAAGRATLRQRRRPDTVELVDAVAKWAETGAKPSTQGIVANLLDAAGGASLLSRPLCPYPTFPKYSGSGDANLAASYTCQSS